MQSWFSPIEQLEAAWDGPIPPDLRAAATAASRDWSMPPERDALLRSLSAPRGVGGAAARRATARSIADAMIRLAGATGACTEADLHAAGFTAAELAALAEPARAIARRRFSLDEVPA